MYAQVLSLGKSIDSILTFGSCVLCYAKLKYVSMAAVVSIVSGRGVSIHTRRGN